VHIRPWWSCAPAPQATDRGSGALRCTRVLSLFCGCLQEAFLSHLESLQPDLCITAAYGNILPSRFLAIPRLGTLNIHPSLLPRFRGAAPVNRCLENGDSETGVSLAFTVLACDAGPILAQEKVQLCGDEQAPQLLRALFELGSKILIENLPVIWSGQAEELASAQRDEDVTYAPKMERADGELDFSLPASKLHNKVRPGSANDLK
jgi:methionyl-tRNA formyltransferase